MQKRKILVVVNYFYPYISGVSEYSRSVAKGLALHHDVTVLTGQHTTELPEEEEFEGSKIIRCKPNVFLDKGYISVAFVKRFHLLASQNDVVNLHLPMLESGLFALLSKKPSLVTYQCDMALIGSFFNKIAVLSVRKSMAIALSKADKIVVLSQDYALSSPLVAKHLDKLVEISPPNRFSSCELSDVVSCKSATSYPNFICGFVGRFVSEKGIETILEAAELLKGQTIEFWLAGDYLNVAGGSIYNVIKDKISALGSTVRLLGPLSDKELIGFYEQIDVLLLPSTNRFEAFGMVQMEAMTFGASVVTSDMPGVSETVRKTKIGQLCTPKSGQSLADAILRARTERSSVTRAEVRSAVLKEFNTEKFISSYLSLIETVALSQEA